MQASAEISHKIRLAIKTKLTELGAYVDDELPDYVLVMVANRRGRAGRVRKLVLSVTNFKIKKFGMQK